MKRLLAYLSVALLCIAFMPPCAAARPTGVLPADTLAKLGENQTRQTEKDSLCLEKNQERKEQSEDLKEQLRTAGQDVLDDVKGSVIEAKDNLKETVSETKEKLKENFSELKDNVTGWFNKNIKANTVGDFEEQQRQNNHDFALMLLKPWQPLSLELLPAPTVFDAPLFGSKNKPASEDTLRTITDYTLLKPAPAYASPVPVNYYAGAGDEAVSQSLTKLFISFKFYGEEIKIYYTTSLRSTTLGKGKEKNVSKFWEYLSKEDFNSVLFQFYQYKEDLGLSDLLYYQMVQIFADNLFIKSKNGENLAFAAFILNQTGYDARIARIVSGKKEETALLLPFYEDLYNLPYVTIAENKYYLYSHKLSKKEMSAQIYCYENAFATATRPLSAGFNPAGVNLKPLYGQFNGYIFNERIAEIENYLPSVPFAVLPHTPFSELMRKTLQYRFKPDLDSLVQKQADADLRRQIGLREKQEIEVAALLDFIEQKFGLQAKQSAKLTGKALYPDLMFFRKGSGDIKDRSLLFFQIANRILEIPCILLDYGDYAVPAVAFDAHPENARQAEAGNENARQAEAGNGSSIFNNADKIIVEGKTYYLCGKLPKTHIADSPGVYVP